MLLGADPIASTPIAGLLTSTASSAVVSLANDPRFSARRNQNVKIRWGNDPQPAGPGVEFVTPEPPKSPGIGAFDVLTDEPQIEPIRIDPPDIAQDVIRQTAKDAAARHAEVMAERTARRLREHQKAQARRQARAEALAEADRLVKEAIEAERARLAAEAAERERVRLELVDRLQFDPRQFHIQNTAHIQALIAGADQARADVAQQMAVLRDELTVLRDELGGVRSEIAQIRNELTRVQNNAIAAQTAAQMLFSGD